MTAVVVRPATQADAAGLAHVNTRSWQEAYAGLLSADLLAGRVIGADTWVERLTRSDPRASATVAVDGSEVIGFASVGPELTDPDSGIGHLYAIYLLADWWGKGVGHLLHTAGLQALSGVGFETAILWVLDGNARAIAFYQREGWRFDGRSQVEEMGSDRLFERRMSRSLVECSRTVIS